MLTKFKTFSSKFHDKWNMLRNTEKGRQMLAAILFVILLAVILAVYAGVRAWLSQFPEDTWNRTRQAAVQMYEQQQQYSEDMEKYAQDSIVHETAPSFELAGYTFTTNLDQYEDSWYDAVCTGPNKYTILFMQSDPEMYQKTLYTVYLNVSPIGVDPNLCVELVSNSSAVLGLTGCAEDFEITVERG